MTKKNKLLLNITLLFSNLLFAQISFNFSISEKINSEKSILKISITNQTNDYYILPFDKGGFKAYYSSEFCADLKKLEYPYKYFAPSLIFRTKNSSNYIEASGMRMLHISEGEEKKYIKQNTSKLEKKRKLFSKWKKKYDLKNDTDTERNLLLLSNLLFLEPKQKITYEIEMDISLIFRTEESLAYDYYIFDNNTEYNMSLMLCVDEDIYSYLTNKQKYNLRKYKFYNGTLQSNTVVFKFSYD